MTVTNPRQQRKQYPAKGVGPVTATGSDPVDERTHDSDQSAVAARRDIDPDVVAWVQRSCLAQGIAVKITDTAVIEQVCVLLTGTVRSAATKAPGRGTSSS